MNEFNDGVKFHDKLVSREPFVRGKELNWEEAVDVHSLDKKSRTNETKRLKNMRAVRQLESDIAFHIQRSGDQPVEVGEA